MSGSVLTEREGDTSLSDGDIRHLYMMYMAQDDVQHAIIFAREVIKAHERKRTD
jgi:hypothetical protein